MLDIKWKRVLIIIIGLALVASFYVAYERIAVEQDNNQVEVALLWSDFISSASKEGLEIEPALEQAKTSVNAFIFREMKIEDLIAKNIAMDIKGFDLQNYLASGTYSITDDTGAAVTVADLSLEDKYLLVLDENYAQPIVDNMRMKSGYDIKTYTAANTNGPYTLISYNDVNSSMFKLGLVFDVEAMTQASEAGYYIIPRFSAWDNYQAGEMAQVLEPLGDLNYGGIMFNDKEVIKVDAQEDYDPMIEDMAQALAVTEAPLVFIEFYGQQGLSDLIQAYNNNFVRLHTVNDGEMEKITEGDALNRFSLAISERNVGIAYVKPFADTNFSSLLAYTEALSHRIEDKGYSLGMAQTIDEVPQNNGILVLIAFGIAAGAVFLGERLRIPKVASILSLIMVIGVIGLALTGRSLLAAKVIALVAALVFPALAVTTYVGGARTLGKTLVVFFKICGITLVGAIFIVGLLSMKPFMTSLSVFSGVKLAMVGPLLVVLIYCLFIRERQSVFDKTYNLIKQPVRYGELIILALLALALLVLVMRSGNDGLDPTSLELAFRNKLEELLLVRPRTKEFLIGTPCLLLALYFGYKDFLVPLWLLGAIGQVSILNTFCHLHTPLTVSLLRTFNGLWLGILIGIVAIVVISWLVKKFKKKVEGNVL